MARARKGTSERKVRAQYEAYPYPERDPADEAKRLIVGSPSHLAEIEHYVFAGKRAGALSALVAGGGTGDGAIMLAQQLAERGNGGSVQYLDISASSLAVAQARAAARGLDNIQFLQGSLLDVADLVPGPYDYIDCCGVLHHLDDPAAGLRALVDVLAPGGGLGVMLYGALGRTGVYPLQSAIARLARSGESGRARLALAADLLAAVPETNWLKRNPYLGDHLTGGTAGLYDLLLHARDRAYRIAEVVELTAGAGLAISGLIEPARYQPETYIGDNKLRARMARLPEAARWALAEELAGNIKAHVFYAVRAADQGAGAAPWPPGDDRVPVLRELDGPALALSFKASKVLSADFDGVAYRRPVPEAAAEIAAQIDGRRTLAEIRCELGWPKKDFRRRFEALWQLLHPLNLLLLSGPS